jgi:hypothetical protein
MFRSPQINVYVEDVPRAAAFYEQLGSVETFRTPAEGVPIHVEVVLGGFRLGLAQATG